MKRWTACVLIALAAAACPPSGGVPPPDGGVDGGVISTGDLCGFLASAHPDTTYELAGTHDTPYVLGDGGTGGRTCVLAPTAANVTLRAAPGANPLLEGFLVLYGANGWTFDNIDFTQDPVPPGAQTPAEAGRQGGLLKFVGGNGWKVVRSKLFFPSCQDCGDFGALSFGFTQSYPSPTNWEISDNWIHDNPGCVGQPFCTNGTSQSKFQNHLIYGIGNPSAPQNGVIRNNLLVNSPNGFAIKLGGSGSYDGSQGVNTVLIENNTVVQNESQTTSPAAGQMTGLPVLVDDDSSNLTFRRNIFYESSAGASDQVATLVLGTGYNLFGKGFSTAIVFDDNVMTAPTSAVVSYFQGCAAELLPRSASTTFGFNKYPIGCAPQTAILTLSATVDGSGSITWPAPTPGACALYGPLAIDGGIYGAPAGTCTDP